MLPGMDQHKFDALYLTHAPSVSSIKHVPKIFPKQIPPPWLQDLGDPFLDSNRKWALNVPDCLIAHVAGSSPSPDQEFTVHSSVDLLKELFDLNNNRLPDPPSFGNPIPPLKSWYSMLKFQLKSLSLAWVHSQLTYPHAYENTDLTEHIIVPSLSTIISSITHAITFVRELVLPPGIPQSLYSKFINAPLFPLFPTDFKLRQNIQFFRAKQQLRYLARSRRATLRRGGNRGRRGRGRGRISRGSPLFRGINRGTFGNPTRNSFRGQRSRGTRYPTSTQQSSQTPSGANTNTI